MATIFRCCGVPIGKKHVKGGVTIGKKCTTFQYGGVPIERTKYLDIAPIVLFFPL